MQIEGLKVTDYIKTEGTDSTGFGVGTSGIKDDNKANKNKELRTLSVDNAFYDNKGKMADEEFMDDVNKASALGMSTVKEEKNIERAWNDEATAKAREDGHDPMDMDSHTLVTVVDEIKMNLAKAGADISKMGGLDADEIQAMTGSVAQAVEMTRGLSEKLPVETQAYLVKNDLEPTITNIYNATYSAPANPEAEEATDEDIISLLEKLGDKLDSLIEEVESEQIQSAQKSMSPAELKDTVATMLKQDVPVTKEHLEYMAQLAEYEKPSEENIVNAISDIVAEGKEPAEAYLVPGYSLMDQAREKVNEVMSMDPSALPTITMQRQLTEIQLTMTVQATFTMMKNGVKVNTNDLSDLLDKLKLQETNLLQILMKAEKGEATTNNVNLFKQVMNEMAEIQSAPASMLGRFSNINAETFSYVHEVSVSVTAEYTRMEMTYEAVGTEVRTDLGDSMSKAFQNVDDILEDLGIEQDEASQKAVRILAYNKMEITAESVTSMKASSEMVNRTFKSMTPAVVAEMIKRGDNPLDMTMEQLKEKAESLKAELGSTSDEESFAKFLWKAEHNSQITEEQREAFVGVYRLLHQVDKSDGAAIGALISQGTEVTMRNLMTAVRSSKHTGRDYEVNDKFGQLEEMVVRDLSITEQIEKVFLTDRCRDAKEAMTPAKMIALGEDKIMEMNPDQLATAMERVFELAEENKTLSNANELEQVKNAYELEVEAESEYNSYVTEQIKTAMAADEKVTSVLDAYNLPHSANLIAAVEEMLESSDRVFKNLYTKSLNQRMEVMSDREGAGAGFLGDLDIGDLIDLAYTRFAESCNSPEEMADAQEALATLAENVMKTMIETEDVRTVDMNDMKLVVQQTKLMNEMARSGETYHIPIMVADEAGNMSLKIVRGNGESGLIKMALYMQQTGAIQTTFHYEAGQVRGEVECESAQIREMFASQAPMIAQTMQEETGFAFSFSFTQSMGLSATEIYMMNAGETVDARNTVMGQTSAEQLGVMNQASAELSKAASAKEEADKAIQTRALYSIARGYINVIGDMF